MTKQQLEERTQKEKKKKIDEVLREKEGKEVTDWLKKLKAEVARAGKTSTRASSSSVSATTVKTGNEKAGGAVLNPNLKDGQSLSSPAGPAPTQPGSTPERTDRFLTCSTFSSPDSARRDRDCPEPGRSTPAPVSTLKPEGKKEDPFGRGTPEQQKAAEEARWKAAHDPSKIVGQWIEKVEEKETCGIPCANPSKSSYGRFCKQIRRERVCDVYGDEKRRNCKWAEWTTVASYCK